MAELEQLASDALITPKWVLPGQRQHQLPALGRHPRPAGSPAAAKRCPATMDERSVPTQNRGRLHQEQGPSRQPAAQCGQDHAVGGPPTRSWCCASEDEQLLAKDEEFEIAIRGWAATEDEEVDQQAKEGIEEGQQHGRAE